MAIIRLSYSMVGVVGAHDHADMPNTSQPLKLAKKQKVREVSSTLCSPTKLQSGSIGLLADADGKLTVPSVEALLHAFSAYHTSLTLTTADAISCLDDDCWEMLMTELNIPRRIVMFRNVVTMVAQYERFLEAGDFKKPTQARKTAAETTPTTRQAKPFSAPDTSTACLGRLQRVRFSRIVAASEHLAIKQPEPARRIRVLLSEVATHHECSMPFPAVDSTTNHSSSSIASSKDSSAVDVELLKQWAAADSHRGGRNDTEAHPLGGPHKEQVLQLFLEAVNMRHPSLPACPRVCQQAYLAADKKVKKAVEQATNDKEFVYNYLEDLCMDDE